jgi:hypothetical protein
MRLDPNIALFAALTFGAGYLMVLAGLSKSALELKRRRRFCASCGRALDQRVCPTCASA